MANRIVIDPVTRIEGHLRVEVEVKDGKVVDAYSSGTMVRGFEIILKGRDPRDAWAFCERACGVCTTVHALASVRTVEDALGIAVPPNWVGHTYLSNDAFEQFTWEPGYLTNYENVLFGRDAGFTASYMESLLMGPERIEVLSLLPRELTVLPAT